MAAGQRRLRAFAHAPRCDRARSRPTARARIAADAAIECINCGICYAACDTVRWNDAYLGPAALNRAWSLVNDERDAGNSERLQPSLHPAAAMPATRTSPARSTARRQLNPTASIAGLKRRTSDGLSQGRAQGMNVRLYVWQRLTAAIMAPLVLAHVAVIFYATRKGLSAADILGRTRGSLLGRRSTARSLLPRRFMPRSACAMCWPNGRRSSDRRAGMLATSFGVLLLLLGLRAVAAVVLS